MNYITNLITDTALMHNKFTVIDNRKLITGSYNWTINANSNNENIFVIEDKLSATYYCHEFRRIASIGKSPNRISMTELEHNGIINSIIDDFKNIVKEVVDLARSRMIGYTTINNKM